VGKGRCLGEGGAGHNLATFAGKKFAGTNTQQHCNGATEREREKGVLFSKRAKNKRGPRFRREAPTAGPRRDLAAGPRRPLRPPVDVPPK